jgi:16S rRNA (guanine(966)-N(2))-methyltransferase RsmD
MRIIGGKLSRRVIKPPKNLPVRPTTDLAKESLFNILRHKTDFTGKNVLDLFAGTGSLTYEFASRGCATVLSIEKDYNCVQFIKDTIKSFEMTNVKVIRNDVFRFIRTTSYKFDIIFADPPYDHTDIENILPLIYENELLNDNGYLIIEHPPSIDFTGRTGFIEHRKYGHVNFSFFQFKA